MKRNEPQKLRLFLHNPRQHSSNLRLPMYDILIHIFMSDYS